MRPPPRAVVGLAFEHALGSYTLCLAYKTYGSEASFTPRIELTPIQELANTNSVDARALLAHTSITSPQLAAPFVFRNH